VLFAVAPAVLGVAADTQISYIHLP